MTGSELRGDRHALGMTQHQLAVLLGTEERTLRKWEADPARVATALPVPPLVANVVGWMLFPGRPPSWPATSWKSGDHAVASVKARAAKRKSTNG